MEISNPRYNAHGTIDVTINHPNFGIIDFTASPSDREDHGRQIYSKAVSGDYGEITEYTAPEVT